MSYPMNLEDVQMALIQARMALASDDVVREDVSLFGLVERIDNMFFRHLTPIHMMNLYERSAPGKPSQNFPMRQAYRKAAARAITRALETWSEADEHID